MSNLEFVIWCIAAFWFVIGLIASYVIGGFCREGGAAKEEKRHESERE